MAEVYALLRDDGSLLYADKSDGVWKTTATAPDTGPAGNRLAVFVLGADISGMTASFPSRNEREARLAAPFAIEDDVAEPVEQLHVALGPPPRDNSLQREVLIASRAQMDIWLEALKAAGQGDATLLAAHSVLPAGDRYHQAGAYVLGRIADRSFVLDRSIGGDVFLGLADGVTDLHVAGDDLAVMLNRSPVEDGLATEDALLLQLIDWTQDRDVIDLRQGDYRVRRAMDLAGLNRWRLLAAMIGIGVIGWFVSVLLETHGLNARAEALEARTVEYVNAGWPEAGGNAARIVSTSLSRAAPGAELPSALTVMAALYEAIESVPDTELRSVRYDRERGQMTARIGFADYENIDLISAKIETSGLTVSVGDARQSGAVIVGELTLEAPQ
ncbi:MAG: type II secretion system protein GspL [Henriciella sp.]|nr:type II secretion system protein GspL [Henriciella sp.]